MSDETAAAVPRPKRPYYRPTTADQRRVLFEVYEQTDSPKQACAAAHVGLGTLYHWRQRFRAGGYPALAQPRSHAPHTCPRQLPAAIVEEVIAAKRAHPDWGRRRIADELQKGPGWQAVVSASQARRILIAAGLWPQAAARPK